MAVASLFEDLLDQYKIEQRLAEKRYTDLYQAYDVDDDRLVRLDIMRANLADDGFTGRFVTRARAVAQLRHPAIAPIYHIGKTADGRPYVAQAHIDGLPLSQRLEQLAQRETPVNALYALKLVRQLADALVLAERLELLHHDLQPDNVWLKNVALTSDESLVLLDLFIPNNRRPPPADEREDYRSPEVRAGREVTAAGHVYSLGVLLYQLLSGQLPGGPRPLPAATLGRLRAGATALERTRPGLSRQTYDLVERCLRREPGRRYESVEAFLAALDGAQTAEEARLSLGLDRPAESRRSLGWVVPLLILALVVAATALAARWQHQMTALAEPTSALAAYPVVATPTLASPPPTEPPTVAPTGTATEVVAVATEPPAPATAEPTQTPADTPASSPTPSATPTATDTATAAPTRVPVVHVALNQVNLRRGPGVVYNTIGSVRSGEALQVLAWNDDDENPWFLVLTADQRLGWVSAEVVETEDAAALAAVPAAATLPPTPFPTSTPPPLPTSTPPPALTPGPVETPNDGGDDPGEPDPEPTDEPAEPTTEPTPTPPPLP